MNPNNVFDAPIPGQSLTQPPGASPVEHPPRFVHLDDALEYVWGRLHNKKKLAQMYLLLKNEVPAEALARTILYQGLLKSLWTVDLALLMFQTVLWQIEAIAKLKGIKYKTFNDDKGYNNFMLSMDQMQSQNQDIDSIQNAAAVPSSASSDTGPSKFKGFF